MNFNVHNVQMGRVDGHNPHYIRKDLPFTWTNVYEEATSSSSALGKRKYVSFVSTFYLVLSRVPQYLWIWVCFTSIRLAFDSSYVSFTNYLISAGKYLTIMLNKVMLLLVLIIMKY